MTPGLYLDDALRILNPLHRELEPEIGARSFVPAKVKGIDRKARTITAIVSSGEVDCYEDVLDPAGWTPDVIAAFMKKPICPAGHVYIGEGGEPTSIGKWVSLRNTKDGLEGVVKFMDPGDPLADAWWARFEQGVVRAFSVGVICKAYEMRSFTMPDGTTRNLRVFTEFELLEISAVLIPANRESLVRAASAAGVALALASGANDESGGGTMSNRRLNKTIARMVGPIVREELARALTPDSDSGSKQSSRVDDAPAADDEAEPFWNEKAFALAAALEAQEDEAEAAALAELEESDEAGAILADAFAHAGH